MKTENSRIITNENAKDKTKVSYIRVSSSTQNEQRQLENIKDLDIYKIYVEKISAKDTNRPLLKQMLEYVREGDSIYITDFSRLARSTKDLLNITEELDRRGIKLISLKESLDTSTPSGKMMLTMLSAIYQFERENTLERQREGIAIAVSQNKYKGRKEIPKPEQWNEIYNLYKNRTITGTEAMKRLNLRRNTFYKFVSEEKS